MGEAKGNFACLLHESVKYMFMQQDASAPAALYT